MCCNQSEMWVATKSQQYNHYRHYAELVIFAISFCNVLNNLRFNRVSGKTLKGQIFHSGIHWGV